MNLLSTDYTSLVGDKLFSDVQKGRKSMIKVLVLQDLLIHHTSQL